jgi:hypothetical protein
MAKIINMAVIITVAMVRQRGATSGFLVTHRKPFTCSGIRGIFCGLSAMNWVGDQASSACRLLLVNLLGPLALRQRVDRRKHRAGKTGRERVISHFLLASVRSAGGQSRLCASLRQLRGRETCGLD